MGGTFSNTARLVADENGTKLSHSVFLLNAIKRWQLRQSMTWEPGTGAGITQYSANVRWPQMGDFFNETRLRYTKNSDAKLKLSHQFSWRTNYFNLQLGASVDSHKSWDVRLGIAGSLYQSHQSKDMTFSKPKGSNTRRIKAVAFVDHDSDGMLGEGDHMLADVKFSGRSDWKANATDENGTAELFTSSDYQSITLDETSFDDPFLTSAAATKIVSAYAGGVTTVYFPLLTVNEIEGSVVTMVNNQERGLLGLSVYLKKVSTTTPLESEVVLETQTQSDGYFFFARVQPGRYMLSIDPNDLKKMQMKALEPIEVIATAQGDIVVLDNVVLQAIKHSQSDPPLVFL